jgi:sugar O-acyltransferase (sialic acid O-acetyltransferase NeuD family)
MYLYGASGHCKVVIDIIQKSNLDSIEYIIDDNPNNDVINSIPIIKTQNLNFFKDKSFIITIGNNKIRKGIVDEISTNYLTAIHPNSFLASNVHVGKGSVIMAGAILNSDVRVGDHCIINSGAVVEHDCVISDFAHISPNVSLAGNITIGEGSHVGIGAVIIQGVKIGKWVTIGAGSIILKDVPDYAVIVGNPGKIIKFNSIENE